MQIKIENLSFSYKSPWSAPKEVLTNVSLTIAAGEMLALVGPSGSGKTTLMQHLTGLLKPDTGRICVDGQDIWQGSSLNTLRRRIGLVFQFPETQLFGETVLEDVVFGPRNLGLAEGEVRERAELAMQQVDLDVAEVGERSPLHLSEGERRRVALAGVLSMQPECLALDEPTAGLDAAGTRIVLDVLRQQHRQGRTIILVSHDIALVSALLHRIVVLNDGRVHFDGKKEDLFKDQAHLAAAGIVPPKARRIACALKRMGLVATEELYSFAEIKNQLDRHRPIAE